MERRAIIWIGLVLSLIPLPSIAAEGTATSPLWVKSKTAQFPSPKVFWIDWKGQRTDPKWKIRSRWLFDRESKNSPVGQPALRIWIELPSDFKDVSLKGSSAFEARLNPEDQPFEKPGSGHGSVLRFDLNARMTSATVEYTDAKGKAQDIGLWVELDYDEPVFWLDRSCWDRGISIQKQKLESKFLYAGVVCKDDGLSLNIVFMHSADAVFKGSTFSKKSVETSAEWSRVTVKKPSTTSDSGDTLGKVKFANKTDQDFLASEYAIVYRAKKRSSRWEFLANLGPTYMRYSETPGPIELSELALTLKLGASFKIVPKRIDASASAYFTLLPLWFSSTPAAQPSARFLGINGRLNYLFAGTPGKTEWSLGTGWYMWSMFVSGNAYGISLLTGPQLFLQTKRFAAGERAKFAYFKFAPITAGASIPKLADRELAIGGGFQLNSPLASKALLLTLDVADIRLSPTQIGLIDSFSINMLSVSAGLQMGW
ncbi:hypothetical protein WDW86_01315 [Bdellovibrionota bacterium FG-2]